jgi:hypothetical protein
MGNYEIRLQVEADDCLQEQHGNSVLCYHALFDHRGYIQAISLDEYITVSIPWQTGERIKRGELRLSEAYDAAVETIEKRFEEALNKRDSHVACDVVFPNGASGLFHAAHNLD